MQTALHIERALKKVGTAKRAASSARFFKTGKGEYGQGDIFVGVTVPEQRKLAKEYATLPQGEIAKLLKRRIHECRLTALILLIGQYKSGDEAARTKIARFYLARTKYVNSWDLVDVSAGAILGTHLLTRDRRILYRLARSKNIWERRIAIIATLAFIKAGDVHDTLLLAELLLADTHDLMHKAVGWMLREVGKQARPALVCFLKINAAHMPRTALRYAIEHFGEAERKKFLRAT
ncbi:MAG: DNA alkylation repair protein [Candidatus Lloydbacteria bacterium RIFCSPHIGHO2_01_FULL_49_22]|uniref:DNA alkylation repair protein n=1 Tax=Candidatus Lloydbacteria bacterium RIFCSPHIGHO2_01_FULL_49_22 TaxID=1798658 RepID=A0A1G2CZK7_9BACT|nr:MAG: DNA alkylation repair protein [Candidatus Lloydbacteria bacterium RIFCSPHIGHO2_01_FULL_49_22]OGZ10001.1 MAG: DNA alkylation repair protein [Candidatus Lloydbacteria bacterium RIFCSPHIGHO2_02_FULL_50_18]